MLIPSPHGYDVTSFNIRSQSWAETEALFCQVCANTSIGKKKEGLDVYFVVGDAAYQQNKTKQ